MPSQEILDSLERIAIKHYDGHFTVMRFTTNWRVGFRTPSDRINIEAMAVGSTLEEAASRALADPKATRDRVAAARRLGNAYGLCGQEPEDFIAEEAATVGRII